MAMSKYPLIVSAQNPRIKMVVKLRSKRQRDQTQRFLIEGYRELFCAKEAFVPIEELFFSPEHFLGSNERDLIESLRQAGVSIHEVSQYLFDKLSYRDRGDGLIAVAKQTHRTLQDLTRISQTTFKKFEASASVNIPKDRVENIDEHFSKKPLETSKKRKARSFSKESEKCRFKQKQNLTEAPFFLIAEAIEKPGNLGSILRSADAAGAHALILCDSCTDIHNPNVVRASVGTLFTVPIIEATTTEVIKAFREWGIRIVASTPSATHSFTNANLTGPIGIAVGTEQLGLSSTWLKHADILVKIPMHGQCDSLNVAAATTLLLYEVVRQRTH